MLSPMLCVVLLQYFKPCFHDCLHFCWCTCFKNRYVYYQYGSKMGRGGGEGGNMAQAAHFVPPLKWIGQQTWFFPFFSVWKIKGNKVILGVILRELKIELDINLYALQLDSENDGKTVITSLSKHCKNMGTQTSCQPSYNTEVSPLRVASCTFSLHINKTSQGSKKTSR